MFNTIILNLLSQEWIKSLIQKANTYIVGGCVRDTLMAMKSKDIDIIVEGLSIEDIKNLLRLYGKVDIVGQSFSIIKFTPFGHIGEPYDIAIPRMDKK